MRPSGGPSFERRVVGLVAADLRERGWEVDAERTIGLYQVDLLATAPSGRRFAIEVKASAGKVHFGTLNNVAALRGGLAAFGDLRVTPVLLAIGTSSPSLHELADRLGLWFVLIPPGGDHASIAEHFVKRLVERASQPVEDAERSVEDGGERLVVGLSHVEAKRLAERISLKEMAEASLFRVGRWRDVDQYPPPSPPVSLAVSEPMLYGARWADPLGEFSTLTFSTTPEAAIGSYLARFRRSTAVEGRGILDAISEFLQGEPGEPLREAFVPVDMFDDLWLLHVRPRQHVLIVDLDAPSSRDALGQQLSQRGLLPEVQPSRFDLTQSQDRRVTWFAIRALYEASAHRRQEVGGLRYASELTPLSDSAVLWSPPTLVPLDRADVQPLSPRDPEVERAAEELRVSIE